MKAMRVNGWGQPLKLEDIPQPKAESDNVLVRVHAASINPFDSYVHAGYMQGMVNTPLTLGTDFAGEVVEAGPEVRHVKPGDAVYGLVPMHSGSFAEYLVAKGNEVTHKPKTLNFVQAAGVPLASLAAYQSLFDLGQLQKGQRVLIIGAAGAVGGCAIQLAKDLGAYVYGVDIPDKADFVRELGVDRFIDAKEERYEDVVGTVDLVLDYVGGDNLQRSYSVLKSGGHYVTSLILQTPQEEADRRGIHVASLATQPRVDQLDDLARRIDSGRLKIFINSTFPLHEAQAAMEYRLKTTNPGKIVLTVL
jgi:NADPH:quinone reductase-like Zn-dependent oxidoreductase